MSPLLADQTAKRSPAALRLWRAMLIAGMTVMAAPHEAAAQQSGGVFGTIFNFFGGSRDDRFAPVNAYVDTASTPESRPELQAPTAMPEGGATTYCVRLCDGRYFPLSSPAASPKWTPVKACAAMCPAARTAVYRGGAIDGAVGTDGERYADLANAFVYRARLVENCTCNGHDAFGLARIDITTDPTLRAGDIVATRGRLQVFKGSRGDTHKAAEFTPIGPSVSADTRRKLAGARVSRRD